MSIISEARQAVLSITETGYAPLPGGSWISLDLFGNLVHAWSEVDGEVLIDVDTLQARPDLVSAAIAKRAIRVIEREESLPGVII